MRSFLKASKFLLSCLLSDNVRQRSCIKRNLIATAVYGVSSALFLFGVSIGIMQAEKIYPLIILMLSANVVFYAVIRSGCSLSLRDPYLTLPQIIAAITWSTIAYGISNKAHGGTLMALSMVLVFGVFSLRQRQVLICSVYAVITTGSMMFYKTLHDPEVYEPFLQVIFFIVTVTTILTIATITMSLSELRQLVKYKNSQLSYAMQQFQTNGQVPAHSGINNIENRLWQQFIELVQQRRELEEQRSMMLASISHDLRSPLGRIRMAAELLPNSKGVDIRRESIKRNVDVANRLLTNFIDMARADYERIEECIDLRTIVFNLVREVSNLKILNLHDPTVYLARANTLAVERVLRNLLDNASIYGAPPFEIGLRREINTILWFRDHGPGVSPDLYEYFLEPFTRAETTRMQPGTGLGLAIVKRTLERCGGHVILMNANPGLCVELHFPSVNNN